MATVDIEHGNGGTDASGVSESHYSYDASSNYMEERCVVIGIGEAWAYARLYGYHYVSSSDSYDVTCEYFRHGNTWGADTNITLLVSDGSTTYRETVEQPSGHVNGTVTKTDQFYLDSGNLYTIGLEVRGEVAGPVEAFSDYDTSDIGHGDRYVEINSLSIS